MTTTMTGSFGIGVRRGGGKWQSDLGTLIGWAKDNGFVGLDVGAIDAVELKQIVAGGLRLGSVDLLEWDGLISADAAKRRDAAAANADYIKGAVAAGARNFFVVMLPEDPAAARSDNLNYAVDGYGQLCQAIEPTGAKIVLEGWPGGEPHFAALACTPESYQLVFDEVGSDVLGVNFDPSHLIRMGIDSVRFCEQFVGRIYHVHGKDTQLLDDELYHYGNLQPATRAQPHGYGGHHWRYCIPGAGLARWDKLLSILNHAGYQGMISIELEDENFNGSDEGEQRGLIASRDFLKYV